MPIQIIAVSQKQPEWVNAGYAEYAKRLSREWQITLNIVPTSKRSQHSVTQCLALEGQLVLSHIKPYSQIVVLDERGTAWNTELLAKQMQEWLSSAESVTFIIGGPDGLSQECKSHAGHMWSLSPLTLPHGLVRVLLAEQLYRAWSIGAGHPYHRL